MTTTPHTDAASKLSAYAAAAWKQSSRDKVASRKNEWITAHALARLSKYGDLRKHSERVGIGEDTAGQLAAAFVVWTWLAAGDSARAYKDRRTFGYRRFFSLGKLWTRYDFEVGEAFEFLESQMATTAMEQEIENKHNPLPEWKRSAIGLTKPIEKLAADQDVPEDLRQCAVTMKGILRRIEIE